MGMCIYIYRERKRKKRERGTYHNIGIYKRALPGTYLLLHFKCSHLEPNFLNAPALAEIQRFLLFPRRINLQFWPGHLQSQIQIP